MQHSSEMPAYSLAVLFLWRTLTNAVYNFMGKHGLIELCSCVQNWVLSLLTAKKKKKDQDTLNLTVELI